MSLPGIALASSVAATQVRAEEVQQRLTRRRKLGQSSAVAPDEDGVEHVPDVDQVELSDAVRESADPPERPQEQRHPPPSRPRLDVKA